MGRWSDRAAELARGAEGMDNTDISDVRPASTPNVANVANVHTGDDLPQDITAGILRLQRAPAPLITRPEIWPVIVADAVMLARHGWAAEALALGWHPLELFGCSADRGGDDYQLGLAAWLAGRKLAVVFDAGAIAVDGAQRAYFNRKSSLEGTIYLWEYGR